MSLVEMLGVAGDEVYEYKGEDVVVDLGLSSLDVVHVGGANGVGGSSLYLLLVENFAACILEG